ncbi:MAG: tetratricopeptide repeat protein [Alicyclobacillaceae bacterium]|nr:tetratricopeptide repeat protein [Alicyclobacillaceae bacterium]
MSSLGQKIRDLRKQRKLTQQELAAGLVTASMISQIESDRVTPSPRLLEQIAQRLGVDAAFFQEDLTQRSDLTQTYRKARLLIDMQQYQEAIPLLEALLNLHAAQFREEVLCQELAECHVQLGQYDKAEALYERVVRSAVERGNTADAVRAYYQLGHIRRHQGQPAVARMFWQRAKDLLSRHPEVAMPLALKIEVHLARAYLALKCYRHAQECFETAMRLADRYDSPVDRAAAVHGLATLWTETGPYDAATDMTQQAIQLYEQIGNLRGINQCKINLAVILRRKQLYEQAVAYLTECLQSRDFLEDPIRHGDALAERALNWFALGNAEAAAEDALRALRSEKLALDVQVSVHELLARIYQQSNAAEPALRHAKQAAAMCRAVGNSARTIELFRLVRDVYVSARDTAGATATAVAFARTVLRGAISDWIDAVGEPRPLRTLGS